MGTSSVGKSSVSHLFEKLGYKLIQCDNLKYCYTLSHNIDTNKYYTDAEIEHENFAKRMVEEGFPEQKVIYDDTGNNIIDLYKNTSKELFIILMYASPTKLVDNMFKRRYQDKRGKSALYKLFTELYTVSTNENDKIIDRINKRVLREKLLEKCKYWFASEEKLNEYVDKFFKGLNIDYTNDDDLYPICLRNPIEYNLFINIEDKTIEDVFEIIHNY